jgi:aspartate carbamoyltransferase catalytic subunit
MRNLLSAKNVSQQDIFKLFRIADKFQSRQSSSVKASSSVVGGLLFFEPSTRTRVGFESAAWRVGAKAINIEQVKQTQSMSKAESMADTIRALDPYIDFICMRHPSEKVFTDITPHTKHPVINCGNGYDEHPTQALIDLYTIWKKFNKVDGITITMVGDLKHSRAAHSLLFLLSRFHNITVCELAPKELIMPERYKEGFEGRNTYVKLTKPNWGKEQVAYSAGFAPKTPAGTYSSATRSKYKINTQTVSSLAKDCIIMNPLPRVDEIDTEVDSTPNAYYFQQNALGLYMRMAILEEFCL